ncbi:ROK family transcriptional regulator [Paenibacillus sp. FSL A5-0031]|uniref:ROK family transcriptional regulator n=1 Tax=Paenibacillus sp. FSL A5-0031 TaxID=1920420 RepID=UPI00211728D5|nr:ROK family transcriptional regulator [Paenibacillus sp. FSL A5-0031]
MSSTTLRTLSGTNLEDVQEMNRSLVMRLVRKNQICSRAEIAEASGLKQSTITNIINEMINWGLIVETGMIEGKKGRRSIGIKLNSEYYKIIGIRLTRTSISVGMYDLDGTEYGLQKLTINPGEGSAIAFKKMKDLITEAISTNTVGKVYAIGMATPGPLFRNEGRIALMSNFPGWEKINIQEELTREYEIPVYLEHDAKAGGMAHWWFGDHQDHGVLIFVTAGQGVGAGIVVDGTVYRGSLGMAGEIGHMSIDYKGPKCECGHNGCLELYCSTSSLLRVLGNEYPSIQAVCQALEAGNSIVEEAVQKAAWFLGFGLVNVVNVYNPSQIVLGDEFAAVGDRLLHTVSEVIQQHVLPDVWNRLEIKLAPPEKDFMLVGAATIAIDNLLNQPSVHLWPKAE